MQVPEFPVYRCEINTGIEIQPEPGGRFFKYWLDHPELGRCLLKVAVEDETSPNRQALDWREKFAYEFGKLLGLPLARTELALVYMPVQDRWVRGTLSIDYTPPGSQIMSFRRFLSQVDANYDNAFNDDFEDGYTVENVLEQLNRHSVGFPLDWEPIEEIESIGDLFVGYLWFDALLGATDRHDENIEIAVSESGYTLCPSFDHGDCLGSKLPLSALSDNYDDRRLTESCWWKTAKIRHRQQTIEISNLEAFEIASRTVSYETAFFWRRRFKELTLSQIDDIFARFPADRLAPGVPKLIQNYIRYNHSLVSHEPNLWRAIIRSGIVIDPEANKTIIGLYLGWRDYATGKWFPIQKMTWHNGNYYTVYLRGKYAQLELSLAHRKFETNINKKIGRVEITNKIPNVFGNLMPIHRNFAHTGEGDLSTLGLSENSYYFDVFGYVARASYENQNRECLFAEVAPDRCGNYHFYFRTRHIDGIETSEYIHERVKPGDELVLTGDRIYHQGFLLGSPPKYIEDMAKDLALAMRIAVEKTNDHSCKVLCHVEVNGKLGVPFSSSYYQPIVDISPYLK